MKTEIHSSPRHNREVIRVGLSFDPTDLRLTRTPFGTLVELEGCTISGEVGGPGLPSKVIRLALPALACDTQVSAKAGKTIRLTDEPELVAPLQLPHPGVVDDQSPEKKEGKKPGEDPPIKPSTLRQRDEAFVEPYPPHPFVPPRIELYEQEAKQPRPLARLVATEQVGPVPIIVVELTPVRLTNDGLLEFAPEIEVTVTCGRSDEKEVVEDRARRAEGEELEENAVTAFTRSIHSRAQAERLVELARTKVLNPEAVWNFAPIFPALISHVDYLIVTDNQTWNASSLTPTGNAGNLVQPFQRLVDWKAKRGLKSRVVTISDIVAGVYGSFTAGARDLQEAIRNFLKWAYSAWGTSWVLLGGDINVVPVRRVPGAAEGHIDTQAQDPPPDNRSFWTGTFLKMKLVNPGTWWPGSSANHLLVRADDGRLIPYDATGASGPAQRGWYFCTDDTYLSRTFLATQFVRVNGPPGEVNARLQWLYLWNTLPTDLYYASLQGSSYGLPGRHDWDLLNNGIYGQHTDSTDFDGVEYETDVSVGRAPVSTEAQATAFVDRVIAYEQFRRPDGSSLHASWPTGMLIVSSNWGGRIWISPSGTTPPGDNRYYHAAGASHSLIKLKDKPADLKWRLIAQVSAADVRVMPFDRNASTSGHGWYYAKSDSDLSPSGIVFTIFGTTFFIPIPTEWIAVYGASAELTPQGYILDRAEPDGSLADQEQLREQVDTELPGITSFSRLYEDEVDLTPAQAAAAPVEHLTEDRLHNALNAGPHFVSLSGHGDSNGCCWLSGNMAQNLTNGYHTFIGYADSCLTNQFDAEDAVSERLLYSPNGGAVAYVGNTRFSWIGVGDNFQRAFFHRLTSTRHLGLLNDIRVDMVNEWTGFYRLYNKWAIFALNLMGDPEMPVWVGRPKRMTVYFESVLDKRVPFVVTVKRPFLFTEIPLSGAAVHIQQGSFARLVFTNAAGQAAFDLNPARLGELEVTVTKSGYRPYLGVARIAGPAWVSGQVIRIIHQHGSPHRSLVRLHLEPLVDGDEYRGWYAQDSRPDYAIILDAVTDAYVSEKKISLFVDLTDEGGLIERFALGYPLRLAHPIPPQSVSDIPETLTPTRETAGEKEN